MYSLCIEHGHLNKGQPNTNFICFYIIKLTDINFTSTVENLQPSEYSFCVQDWYNPGEYSPGHIKE